MKDAHVTLYDVAARAGVSASTASRALAGLNVSKKNLAAVRQAAADLHYIPNEAARSLRVVRTMTVGMVFNELTSMLGMELLGALTSALDRMGYSLFVTTAQGDAEHYDRLVRRFLERRVDALVCVHGHGDGQALAPYLAAGVPAISLITARGAYAALPFLRDSIRTAADEAIASLAARGHKRFAVVMPAGKVHLIGDVVEAVGDRGGELAPPRDAAGAVDVAALFAQLRAMPNAPTALFGFQADIAAILEGAESAGVSVPHDISLIAIRDRSTLTRPPRMPLAMLHVQPAQMGERVAGLLKAWLDDKTTPPASSVVDDGVWMDAATTGPAPV